MARFILALSSELSEVGMIWGLDGTTIVVSREYYKDREVYDVDDESDSCLEWSVFRWVWW